MSDFLVRVSGINSQSYIADSGDNNRVYFEEAPIWGDRYRHLAVQGSKAPTIGGGLVLQSLPRSTAGLPITIEMSEAGGFISKERLDLLRVKAETIGGQFVFSEDDGATKIPVVFDHSFESPVEVDPVDDLELYFRGTIHLLRL